MDSSRSPNEFLILKKCTRRAERAAKEENRVDEREYRKFTEVRGSGGQSSGGDGGSVSASGISDYV